MLIIFLAVLSDRLAKCDIGFNYLFNYYLRQEKNANETFFHIIRRTCIHFTPSNDFKHFFPNWLFHGCWSLLLISHVRKHRIDCLLAWHLAPEKEGEREREKERESAHFLVKTHQVVLSARNSISTNEMSRLR
jgi:hypothetical protein